MPKRYIWMLVLALVVGYINSKGESLFSETVLLGALVGAVIGFVLGLLLEKRKSIRN